LFDVLLTAEKDKQEPNKGFVKRYELTALSRPVETFAPILFDFCNSSSIILPNTRIQIVLNHHNDEYRLMFADDKGFGVGIHA